MKTLLVFNTLFLQAKVVRTKSTETMPFLFSFMMVIVSFLWLCYGTAVEDVNIQVKMPYNLISACLACTCSVNLFSI